MAVAEITHDVASIPDDVTARYLAELRAQEPEAPRLEVEIERTGAFVFRTRAGTSENPRITIPQITVKESLNEKLAPKIERIYQRKYGTNLVAYYDDLIERVGSHRIKFRRIGVGKGAVYQTNDPVVADFIRGFIGKGTIAGLYEDYQTSSQLRSKYTNKLFPNTEAGRVALGAYDLAIEQEATRLQREESALDAATKPDADAAARVAAVKKV